jgi:hypothetical protein
LLWPGGPGGTRRKHRPGWAETQRKHRISAEGCGRPWPPPPPRRNHRLMVPSGPTGPPGRGISWPLRRTFIRCRWPHVTEGLRKNSLFFLTPRVHFCIFTPPEDNFAAASCDDLVKSHPKDGFVKSSRCKARKSDGRGNLPGCPISGGSASRPYLPQRRS